MEEAGWADIGCVWVRARGPEIRGASLYISTAHLGKNARTTGPLLFLLIYSVPI